jgi:hypothetical protein
MAAGMKICKTKAGALRPVHDINAILGKAKAFQEFIYFYKIVTNFP